MVRKSNNKKSSLLAKYSLQYKKKPKSRVFAPLAETYRKLGMYDESLKVLREGMKYHPTYTLGYIVLANVYFDQQNFELAYNTIRPFVASNLENIRLQKLFAEICINLGYLEEALQTFKYLLLINPRDQYVAEQIKLLEDDLLINEKNDQDKGYVEKRMASFDTNEDEWVQVDFVKDKRREEDSLDESSEDHWNVENPTNPLEKFKKDLSEDKFDVQEQSLDDEYYYEEYDNPDEEENSEQITDPIITHTLVDLYCKQGHIDKAIEILESIVTLHPEDKVSQKRLKELTHSESINLVSNDNKTKSKTNIEIVNLEQLPDKNQKDSDDIPSPDDKEESNDQTAHDELLAMVEAKKRKENELYTVVQQKLNDFAEAIKLEAAKKQLDL